MLRIIFSELGRKEDAIMDFSKAIETYPNYATVIEVSLYTKFLRKVISYVGRI